MKGLVCLADSFSPDLTSRKNILVCCLPTDPPFYPRPNIFFSAFMKKKNSSIYKQFSLKVCLFLGQGTKKNLYLPAEYSQPVLKTANKQIFKVGLSWFCTEITGPGPTEQLLISTPEIVKDAEPD